MAELVSLEQVKRNLRIEGDREDWDLTLKTDLATEIVTEWVKQRIYADSGDLTAWAAEVDAWTDTTAPARVKAAILRQVAAMRRFRGDDEKDVDPGWEDGLAPGVKGLLVTLRDPMIA